MCEKKWGPITYDTFPDYENKKKIFLQFFGSSKKWSKKFAFDWSNEYNLPVLNIHLNPRISNYMVICKANSIFVAPRWLSALFLPITWTFRDKVVEFEHLHIFCERI